MEALKDAPFNHIYHNQSTVNLDGSTIRKRRHAEVVTKKQCDLKYLQKIVCRNSAEAETLLDLLTPNAKALYHDKICVIGVDEFDTKDYFSLFKPPRLQIVKVSIDNHRSSINFNKPSQSKYNLEVNWLDLNGNVICHYINKDFTLPTHTQSFNMLKFLEKKQQVRIIIKLDSCLVYSNLFTL